MYLFSTELRCYWILVLTKTNVNVEKKNQLDTVRSVTVVLYNFTCIYDVHCLSN